MRQWRRGKTERERRERGEGEGEGEGWGSRKQQRPPFKGPLSLSAHVASPVCLPPFKGLLSLSFQGHTGFSFQRTPHLSEPSC